MMLLMLSHCLQVPLMLANSGPGSQGWGLSTLYMFAILIGVGTCINYWMIPEVSLREV